MAWTETTRDQYDRRRLRYASDCTDKEWAVIAPFMPAPSKVGRPRKWPMREIWDAIQYIATAVICGTTRLARAFFRRLMTRVRCGHMFGLSARLSDRWP